MFGASALVGGPFGRPAPPSQAGRSRAAPQVTDAASGIRRCGAARYALANRGSPFGHSVGIAIEQVATRDSDRGVIDRIEEAVEKA